MKEGSPVEDGRKEEAASESATDGTGSRRASGGKGTGV